jgi:hypothetical protein
MTDINYPARALNSATDSVTIAGTIISSNPSVSTTGTAVPASATYIGLKDASGNLTGAPSNANGLLVSSFTTAKTGTLASPSTGSVIASFDAANFTHFSLQLSVGTASIQVQQSNDNTTWTPIVVITSGSPNILPTTTMTATGLFSGDIEGNYVRVQVTANSAGSVVASLFLSDGPRHDVGSRYVGVVTGTSIIGKVGIDQTTPGTTNGVQVNAALPTGANVIGGVTQSGTWNVNNVSGTVSLPTGAATSAKQPALGTAGTASSDVITVQGIAGATAVKVDGSASTQPVSGTVTANQGGAPWTVTGTGTAGTPASGVVSVQGISGGTAFSVTPSARVKVNLVRNSYSVTPVTTGAYVQILASTAAAINRLYIFDSSGSAIILATGASGSEVDQLYIGPGGSDAPYELNIASGTRLALKALDTNASVGQFILTALS